MSILLKTIPVDKGIFVFSGDGGNVTAVVAEGSSLLIDSGVNSRVSELSDAIYKATSRPVTRLVSTHWHFDHTGGNVYFGSGGVEIIAQENVRKRLSSPQNLSLIGLHDGPYPPQALPTVTYSSTTALSQGSQRLTLVKLRTCPHRWRYSHLYKSGKCRCSIGYFFESRLSHHRPLVGRISRRPASFHRSNSGAD